MKKNVLLKNRKKHTPKKPKDQNRDMSNSSMERIDFIKIKFH